MQIYVLITILLIIISLLIIGVVLIQNPKGGGLGAGFGGASGALGGVQRSTDFIEKFMWGLAVAFLVLTILSTGFLGIKSGTPNSAAPSEIEQQLNNE